MIDLDKPIEFFNLSTKEFDEYAELLKRRKPDIGDLELQLDTSITHANFIPYIFYFVDKKFPCKRCGQCCVIQEDIFLEDKEFIKLSDFFALSDSELMKKYKIRQQTVNGYCTFKMKGNPCSFYDKTGCSIYSLRPMVCSCFPVSKGSNNTPHSDKFILRIIEDCKREEDLKNAYICFLKALREFREKIINNEELSPNLDEAYSFFKKVHAYFFAQNRLKILSEENFSEVFNSKLEEYAGYYLIMEPLCEK
jgi:Fe-S-cluster containining protein